MLGLGIVPLSMIAVRLLDLHNLQDKFSNLFNAKVSESNEVDINEVLQKMKSAEGEIIARWKKLTSSYPQTSKWLLGQWVNLCEDESFICHISNSFNGDPGVSSLIVYINSEDVESPDDADAVIDENLEGLWENDLLPLGLGYLAGETKLFPKSGIVKAPIIPRLTEQFMQKAPYIEAGIVEMMTAHSNKLVADISSKIENEMADQVHRWAKYQEEFPEESDFVLGQIQSLCGLEEGYCEVVSEKDTLSKPFKSLEMVVDDIEGIMVDDPEAYVQGILDNWDSNHVLPDGFTVQVLGAEYDSDLGQVSATIIPAPTKTPLENNY